MRDPDRIARMLGILLRIWYASPDLRLGQIIENVWRHGDTSRADLFYFEDDKMEAALRDFEQLT